METHNSRSLRKLGTILNVRSDLKKRWGVVSVALITHMVLPNLVLSYGSIFLMKTDNGALANELILAPSVFIITSTLFEPIFKEASESWGSKIGTRSLSIFGVILAFSAVLSNAFIKSSIISSISYGLIGGFGSCITLMQIKYVMSDIFYADVGLIQTIYNIGESLGQSGMPYLIMICFNYYGDQMGFMILSCAILQLLPITLFIRNNSTSKSTPNLQFGDYSRTYESFSENLTNNSLDIQMMQLSAKSWKSPSDENLAIHMSIPEVEEERRDDNQLGFEILPQIPEECEDPDSSDGEIDKTYDKDCIDDTIKRMSVISDRLEILIAKSFNEYSNDEKNNNGQSNDETKSENENKVILRQILAENKRYSRNFSTKVRCCISSYDCYRYKRRFRNTLDYISDTLFVPFAKSIKIWQFYPATLVQICAIFVPMGVSSLLPYMAKSIITELTIGEAIILLTFHGIGWLSFLITSPWIINISKSKYTHFVVAGFFLSSVALFVTMEATHYYVYMLLSWFIGISNGMIALTYKEVLKESIGVGKWTKIHDTLIRVTAILLIPLMFLIKCILEAYGPKMCFGLFSALQGFACVVISVIPILTAIRKTTFAWPGL